MQVLEKIRRGKSHAQLASHRARRFLESKANGVVQDFDSEPEYLIVKAYSRRAAPPSLSILTGECLYQLRSALNHLICHLAEANGESIVDDVKIEFPIRWQDTNRATNDGLKWWEERIGKLCSVKQAIILSEQPFERWKHEPKSDPLWLLYALSDFDRHKSVHATMVTTNLARFETEPAEAVASFVKVSEVFGPVNGDAEVARFRIAHSAPVASVEVKSDVRLELVFDGGTAAAGLPIVSTLGAIGMRVAEVFDALRKPCP